MCRFDFINVNAQEQQEVQAFTEGLTEIYPLSNHTFPFFRWHSHVPYFTWDSPQLEGVSGLEVRIRRQDSKKSPEVAHQWLAPEQQIELAHRLPGQSLR